MADLTLLPCADICGKTPPAETGCLPHRKSGKAGSGQRIDLNDVTFMTLFAVTGSGNPALASSITATFPEDHIVVRPGRCQARSVSGPVVVRPVHG